MLYWMNDWRNLMRIIINIDDIMVEIDDETSNPTVEAIETVLSRVASAAVQIYEQTFDYTSESIVFTPASELTDEDFEDDE